MPKGGARIGAGRPKGSKTRWAAERQLLLANPYSLEGSPCSALSVLNELMLQFRKLAAAASQSGQWTSFTRYSGLARECAEAILPYEAPRLSAIATVAPEPQRVTKFSFNIFNSDRTPFEPPTEVPAIEKQADTITTIEQQATGPRRARRLANH